MMKNTLVAAALLGLVSLGEGRVRADLVLTSAGTAQGLSLSLFASGFPNAPVGGLIQGPLGIAFPVSGGVLVSDNPGNVRLFATDTDGQSAASAPVGQNYGPDNAVALAQIGGYTYMTQYNNGDIVRINSDGTLNQVILTGIPQATGMVADPGNGHLFISTYTSNILYEIDPVAKTKTVFVNASADGVSISPDDKTLYAALSNGHVVGYDIASKAQVFDSGFIPGGPDGTAAGAGPVFSNYVFANTNSGDVVEVNLTTNVQTTIATGGSRGDFVTVDPTNDTLLLTQSDRIDRLSGAQFISVPEPSSLVLGGALGLLVLGARLAPGILRRWTADSARLGRRTAS
jgi:sugar lactone lactonase YvrE